MRPFGDREKGWPRDAREGMGHPDAGDARRSFGAMRAMRAGVAVVAVLASGFAANEAWADGSIASSNLYHYYQGCGQSSRISLGDATCVHGWWDNSPPTSSGVTGSTFGVEWRDSCYDYGDIVVNVDISGHTDRHFHLNTSAAGGRMTLTSARHDVSQISCCWDQSDLCYTREVEAKDGLIVRHTGGKNWEYERVATHQERYDLCQEHPGIIYCRKNPSGDALTPPSPPPPPPLPDVSLQDCYDNFDESPAADSCDNFWAKPPTGTRGRDESERRALELTNGICQSISADCEGRGNPLGGNTDAGGDGIADDLALADVVNIDWCNWTVEKYRRHPTRHHVFFGGTSEYWALLADACPRVDRAVRG